MAAPHRHDAVAPRFLAGDASVAIVVPTGGRGGNAGGRASRIGRIGGHHRAAAVVEHHLRGLAARENPFEGAGLAAVDREAVLVAHFDDALGEPAAVPGRQPIGGVLGAFVGPSAAVHPRGRQGEVEQVRGEPATRRCVGRAQAAIVGLGDGDDVFDVGPAAAGEGAPGIGAVDARVRRGPRRCAARPTGVGIVVPVVGRASVFGGYRQPASCLGGGRRNQCDGGEQDGAPHPTMD